MNSPSKTIDFREVYAKEWEVYANSDVQPAETVLLEVCRERWAKAAMLDLGVGAGRTTWTFAPLVASYTGLDAVPRMVETCRALFPETAQRRFQVGDASDLSAFGQESFDVVLFSYNGIDHLDNAGRLRCLGHVRRVLKAGGVFCFSSHALSAFPCRPNLKQRWSRNPARWPGQWNQVRTALRYFAEANAIATSPEAAQRGWAILPDKAHGWKMRCYYVTPAAQAAQLKACGFVVDQVLDQQGQRVKSLESPGTDWWFHYLCR